MLSICTGNCRSLSAQFCITWELAREEGLAYLCDGNLLSPLTWARSSRQICPVIRGVLFIDENSAIDRMVSTQRMPVSAVVRVHCTARSTNCAQCRLSWHCNAALFCQSSLFVAVRKKQQLHSYLLCFRWQQCGAVCMRVTGNCLDSRIAAGALICSLSPN